MERGERGENLEENGEDAKILRNIEFKLAKKSISFPLGVGAEVAEERTTDRIHRINIETVILFILINIFYG